MSAEVDAAAGVLIGAIALDSARHVREPSQLPIASLPVVLATHQLIEVFVWWGLDGKVPNPVGRAATYAYLFIAFALPLLVCPAVAAMEPDRRRRRLMERLGVVGAVVAVVLLASVMTGPVSAADGGNHIAYQANLFRGGTLTVIYIFATLGCFLASSHRFLVLYGTLNVAAAVVVGWLTISGFVSLWCAWAAVTSIIIALHLRSAAHKPASPRPTVPSPPAGAAP